MVRATRPKSGPSPKATKIFPRPGHDHARCSAEAMAFAEERCAIRGERFTPLRREVLNALLASHQALGAYDIIERLASYGDRPASHGARRSQGRRPAPETVYRALEFLCGNGFVHRLETRNAYLACVNPHAAGDLVVFLICKDCGAVGEASPPQVASSIRSAVRAAGFSPELPVVEISGICTYCRDKRTHGKGQAGTA
jgi:Fur family zinc uptake transcriptional regulator